ncbi:BatD family protein [Desulfococcus sp.]|uniref:BatD family protein n=1 Tax=Desulfococcus sp. TaxID=2025834 RepID=UPI003594809E
MRNRLCWIVAAAILAPAAAMAGVSVQASLDRTALAMEESLVLQVTLRGGKGEVDTDGISDFKVLSRGSSTSIRMVNGQFSQETVYTYALVPLREGRLTIPPLPVQADGETLRTPELSAIVTRMPADRSRMDPQDLFVEADVSETAPFESQQIRYTFRVWQRARIANAKFQRPDFPGFTVRELEERKEYNAVSGGLDFRVTEVAFLLIPVGGGKKTIPSAVLTCDVVRQSGRRDSFFEDPFFGMRSGRLAPRVLRTEPVAVFVKPLPPYTGQGKFSGLVGRFDIDAELASSEVRVGDSTTFAFTIRGAGNIMDAGPPEIRLGDAFKVYDDTPEEEIRLTGEGYSGKKVFRSALVPVAAGTYDLGSLEWVYFDVSRGGYVVRKTPAFSLSVRPADRTEDIRAASPAPSPSKSEVAFVGRDILPLKDGRDAVSERRPISSALFAAMLALPPFLWAAARFAMARLKKETDPGRMMAEKAEKAMREAASLSPSDDDFWGCLYRGLVAAVLSRTGSAGLSLTSAEVSGILIHQGFTGEAAEAAATLLERIESARYGGGVRDRDAGEALLEETRRMVRKLLP